VQQIAAQAKDSYFLISTEGGKTYHLIGIVANSLMCRVYSNFPDRAIPTLHSPVTPLLIFEPRQDAIVMQFVVLDYIIVFEYRSQHAPLISPKFIDKFMIPTCHAIDELPRKFAAAEFVIPCLRIIV
jgi:hypothetical protein